MVFYEPSVSNLRNLVNVKNVAGHVKVTFVASASPSHYWNCIPSEHVPRWRLLVVWPKVFVVFIPAL